jgi:C-terminal processing protease CtpA/Prc
LNELRTQGAKIDSEALYDAADHQWIKGFSDQIAALKAVGISALMIDVGDNSGGDDHGDQFARLLTGRPVRSARLLVTANKAGKDYADEQLASLNAAIATSPPKVALDALTQARDFFIKAGEASKQSCDLSWVWKEQRPWAGKDCKRLIDAGYAGGYLATLPQGAFGDQNIAYRLSVASSFDEFWGLWTGPLYVLTDGKSYSSAEMFTAVVQDNHIGKTIGTTTGGDGCGFMGEDIRQTLPHSGLRMRIPNCVRLRADGSNEVSGIAPDIPIVAMEGEDGRQRGERLIEAVSADNARR